MRKGNACYNAYTVCVSPKLEMSEWRWMDVSGVLQFLCISQLVVRLIWQCTEWHYNIHFLPCGIRVRGRKDDLGKARSIHGKVHKCLKYLCQWNCVEEVRHEWEGNMTGILHKVWFCRDYFGQGYRTSAGVCEDKIVFIKNWETPCHTDYLCAVHKGLCWLLCWIWKGAGIFQWD